MLPNKEAALNEMMRLYLLMPAEMEKVARILGMSKLDVKAHCLVAVSRLIDLDFVGIYKIEAIFLNNMFQQSDHSVYRLDDPLLKTIYGVIHFLIDYLEKHK
eukprot:TRINITY_DN8876_c0_g1_i1.p1 TRINITY_DN8876_c0_g1~~TRINITY_DN8876_c0_g1_i1.p1  ORF type:complete len:102 (-),score=17.18 TRINITY_DN8876_c0_g1_i1:79-384(-)